MNRADFRIVMLLIANLLLSGLVFARVATQSIHEPTPFKADEDRSTTLASVKTQLLAAPWQGPRYLPGERSWRFYGVAGERRRVDLFYPADLVKIYYLQADGEVRFTWAAIQIQLPGQTALHLAHPSVQDGQLVGVQLRGAHVNPSGVSWRDCPTELCRLAEQIDGLLVLDDQGTGITNGFIRHGWEPPTAPMYGYLTWQVFPVEPTPNGTVAFVNKSAH